MSKVMRLRTSKSIAIKPRPLITEAGKRLIALLLILALVALLGRIAFGQALVDVAGIAARFNSTRTA